MEFVGEDLTKNNETKTKIKMNAQNIEHKRSAAEQNSI